MYDSNYLAHRLVAASVDDMSRVFIEHGLSGEKTSYAEFFANAERMAAALTKAGLEAGDRVAVQAPKTIAMLELYVGTVLAGGVFLPLNTGYTPVEVSYFLGNAKPIVFVCDPKAKDALTPIANEAGVTTLWTLDATEAGSLIDARNGEDAGFQAVPRDALDLAAILYTSGTTGRSKGAMLTHRALASNSEMLKDYWHFTGNDVLIHALPIFHTHGLFVATNIALMTGSACLFLPGFDADAIIKLMPRATALMGVPTFYTRLLKQPELADASKNMRLFISGSAPLLAETHDRWSATTGHAILERYGMTETNMNTSNPYDGERRPGTVGFPLPGVELKICDRATGERLPDGEIGVLEVRGDNVFAGYWQMPEKTSDELREDGFFITGDLGKIDPDGYIHIVGRGKDLIISGGFNVYPKEVEEVIDDLDGVLESAVIGVSHPDFGEGVVAVVVPDNTTDLSENDIVSGFSSQLAKFKHPKHVAIVNELPRNTMGKVQKNVLRERYKDQFA